MPFPEGFVWGAASSAYQTEGSPLAEGGGPSIWDTFSAAKGSIADESDGSVAADAYHRYDEDISLAAEMGLHAYRFSVSWARLDPLGNGHWNDKGFQFYLQLLHCCLKAGLTPYVTLYHWELPQALQDKGGWLSPATSAAFARFAREAALRFKPFVQHYITLNEPQCTVGLGHGRGVHAPGLKLPVRAQLQVLHNQLLAHGLAARALRDVDSTLHVGIASTGRLCWPRTDSSEDVYAAEQATFACPDEDWTFTHQMILDPVCLGKYPDDCGQALRQMLDQLPKEDMELIHAVPDFIGLNIYNGCEVYAGEMGEAIYSRRVPGFPLTALKWPVTPQVMDWGVRLLHQRYGLPLYITENGQSCNDRIFLDGKVHDPDRIDFLHRYLLCLQNAIQNGADVRGYFHWALTDNFEWCDGYRERFGLIFVDYPTQKRIPKDSAAWYAQVVASNGHTLQITHPDMKASRQSAGE